MKKLILLIGLLGLLLSSYGQLQVPAVASSGQVAAGGPPYTDDFEAYSAASLGGQGDWLDSEGDILVADDAGNNVVHGNNNWANSFCIYNRSLANNQYAEIVLKNVSASAEARYSIGVRMSGAGVTFDGYMFSFKDESSHIVRIDDGSETAISGWDFSTTYSNNDVIQIRADGTSISVWINGVLETQYGTSGYVTDATYSSGQACIGIYGDVTDGTIDDFEAGEL